VSGTPINHLKWKKAVYEWVQTALSSRNSNCNKSFSGKQNKNTGASGRLRKNVFKRTALHPQRGKQQQVGYDLSKQVHQHKEHDHQGQDSNDAS
jgi:hypothetical protein